MSIDLKHLEPVELAIEAEIRQISNINTTEGRDELESQIKDEEESHVSPPNRPHQSARKQPKREILKCSEELSKILVEIQDLIKEDDIDTEALKRLYSRSVHYENRLHRLEYSKAVREQTQKLLKEASKVVNFIEKTLDRQVDESVQAPAIETLNITTIDPKYAEEEAPGDNKDGSISNAPSSSPKKPTSVTNTAVVGNADVLTSAQSFVPSYHPPINTNATSTTSTAAPFHSNVYNPMPLGTQPMFFNPYMNPAFYSLGNPTLGNDQLRMPNTAPIPTYTNRVPTSTATVPSLSTVIGSDQPPPPPNATPNIQLCVPEIAQARNIQPRKNVNYNLSFDGSPNGQDIERFLFRFETVARTFGCIGDALVDEIHFVLKSKALDYYWSIRQQHRIAFTWKALKESLVERYRDRRTDFDIRRGMDGRRQRRGESFIDFYSEVCDMAISLSSPPPESDMLMLLLRNMKYELQEKLAGVEIDRVADLIKTCVAIEDAWKRLSEYPQNLAPKRVNEVLSDEQCLEAKLEAFRINERQTFRKPYGDSQLDICWNCSEPGHRYTDCQKPATHIFCYGCGTPNVLKPNCGSCARKAENRGRDVNTPGIRILSNPEKSTEAASNTDPELYRRQH